MDSLNGTQLADGEQKVLSPQLKMILLISLHHAAPGSCKHRRVIIVLCVWLNI